MRVLVAGGTGFIGSHIAQHLSLAGCDVRSVARRLPETTLEGVEYVVGDLAGTGDMVASFAGIDVAVFAATTTTPASAERDPDFDRVSNLAAATRFLEAARTAEVPHLVFVSSGGTVYGVPETVPIVETHPTRPISAYGATKLALEECFARAAADGGPLVTILRVGNAFGERQDPTRGQGAPAAFLAALLRNEPVEIWGDGSVVRDHVYAGDVGDAVVAGSRRSGDDVLVLNIGSGEGISLLELLGACARVVGTEPVVVHKESRSFDVPAVVLDVGRAARLLGWRPATPLEEGLRREAAWLERVLPAASAR